MKPKSTRAKVYHPVAPGDVYPAKLALHMRTAASATFAGRLREIATALDPTLKLKDMLILGEALRGGQDAMRLGSLGIGLATLSVLLLSAAGIHALMAFAVACRRREIGIRAALGANPRRLLASIFSRALGQLTIGVAIGVLVAALLPLPMGNTPMLWKGVVLLLAVAVFMIMVGLLAAVGPARRGLRIQPTEALKAEL